MMNENVLAKLKILAESAKYDVPVLPVVRCVPISRERWETLWEDGGYATVLPRTVDVSRY